MTDTASSTNSPPVIAKTISCFVIIPTAPSDPPRAKDPVSPINIFAGGALNHKNPRQAPIIDPQKTVPTNIMKGLGGRILLLNDIGDANNADGPDAWRGASGDLVAKRNDIVEWDGNSWVIVFDASTVTEVTYTTNLNTGVQYRWDGEEWLLSIEGLYPGGTWRIALNG